MRNSRTVRASALLATLLLVCGAARAADDDASRLGKDLTPSGAEKAGNKDGTIPAWTGSEAPASVDVESAAAASWLGDAALAEMGIAVAAAGDVDANGVPDLLIGQPGIEDGGALTLVLWHR